MQALGPDGCAAPRPQIDEGVHFGRDDDDESKVKAMEFFCPRGEQVRCALWCGAVARRPLPMRAARAGRGVWPGPAAALLELQRVLRIWGRRAGAGGRAAASCMPARGIVWQSKCNHWLLATVGTITTLLATITKLLVAPQTPFLRV